MNRVIQQNNNNFFNYKYSHIFSYLFAPFRTFSHLFTYLRIFHEDISIFTTENSALERKMENIENFNFSFSPF